MKPRIAIPQMGNDLFRKYMKSKYTRSLKRAGADVCWLELTDIDKAISEMIQCDGLLMPGGADIEPSLYGQQASEKCGKPNVIRDAAETKILPEFLLTGKPVLCICRGVQILNVCSGGTLIQDIKDIQKCKHSDFMSRARSTHAVTLTEGSQLREIYGADSINVNSIHHQAVDKVGENLIVSAVSEDGFTEALELEGHRFCIGVQWHPEHMSKKSAQQRKLFEAFVSACKSSNS